MKNRRGITVIALIVTIIVLIIIAGVSISLLTGDNGIITKAKIAKVNSEYAQESENTTLGSYQNVIDRILNESTSKDGYSDYFNTEDKVNLVLSTTNLKYNVTLNKIMEQEDIFAKTIDNTNLLKDMDIFYTIIQSKFLISNINYFNKVKDFSKNNLTVTTVPVLTSNGNAFATAPFDSTDNYAIWRAFDNTNNGYAYRGTGSFYLGYKFDDPIWVYEFSIVQRGYTALEEGVDNLKLWYSDDGVNYFAASDTYNTVHSSANEQYFTANLSYFKHTYWKITGVGYGANSGVQKLQFYGVK